jgi:hypothetical protein
MAEVSCSDCRFRRDEMLKATTFRELNIPTMTADDRIVDWLSDRGKRENDQIETAIARGEEYWDKRPYVHPYCGYPKIPGRFRIMDVVNSSGHCEDFEAGPSWNHYCSTCRHLEPAVAEQIDVSQLAGASPVGQKFLELYRDGNATAARAEVQIAFDQGGRMGSRPHQLPTCRKLSSEREWWVGPILNYSHSCPHWEERKT